MFGPDYNGGVAKKTGNSQLQVNAWTGTPSIYLGRHNVNNFSHEIDSSGNYIFKQGGTEQYRIKVTNGYHGILNNNPQAPLHITAAGVTAIRFGDATNDYTFGRNSSDGLLYINGLQAAPYSGYMFQVANGTNAFSITNDGINNIVKSYMTGTGAKSARYDLSTGTANSYSILALADNSGSPYSIYATGPAVTTHFQDVAMHIWRSQAGTEYARLTSTGLGIGAAPAARLHVEHNVAAEMGIFINNPNASGYAAIRIGNSDRGTKRRSPNIWWN